MVAPGPRDKNELLSGKEELRARVNAGFRTLARYGLLCADDDPESALLGLDLGEESYAEDLVQDFSLRLLGRVLLNPDGTRRLPGAEEVRDYFVFGASPVFLPGHRFYLIPTKEGVAALAGYLKKNARKRVVEVGAGDGFLSRCLAERGVEVLAADPGAGGFEIEVPRWVEPLDARAALSKYDPDVVIWAWPPPGCLEPLEIIRYPSVRIYLDIGPDDGSASHRDLFGAHPFKELESVGRHIFGRTDRGDGTRMVSETKVRRFFGAAHPKHRGKS